MLAVVTDCDLNQLIDSADIRWSFLMKDDALFTLSCLTISSLHWQRIKQHCCYTSPISCCRKYSTSKWDAYTVVSSMHSPHTVSRRHVDSQNRVGDSQPNLKLVTISTVAIGPSPNWSSVTVIWPTDACNMAQWRLTIRKGRRFYLFNWRADVIVSFIERNFTDFAPQ